MKKALFLFLIIIPIFIIYFIPMNNNKCPPPLNAAEIKMATHMAQRATTFLNKGGASVVLLGRIGSDLSTYGLRFTHFGFALQNHPNEPWQVIQLINPCGTTISEIRHETLQDFFSDHLFAYDVLVLTPPPDLQKKLLTILQSPLALQLHNARYNMMAYPHSEKYQNSNQWILEIIIAALDKQNLIQNRHAALQSPLMAEYQPDTVRLPIQTCLAARLFEKNVHLWDHPLMDQMRGKFQVVTVRSIVQFLQKLNQINNITMLEFPDKQQTVEFTDYDKIN